MQLPIDYRKAPFKRKYIDSETPVTNEWVVFGHHDDGTVDISDGTDDIFVHVPPDVAETLIEARRQFCVTVAHELCIAANHKG